MEFLIKFNSKTSSPNRSEAIKIAERNINEEKENIYSGSSELMNYIL